MLPKALEEERDIGLTTADALTNLNQDIEAVLKTYEDNFKNESFLHKARVSFARPLDSPLGWFPIILTLLSIFALIFVANYSAAFVITLLHFANIGLVIRENNLRRTEIYRKIRTVLADIKLASALCRDWIPDNFPHLCSPLSPCVTLQWTYRDKRITNIPWALLVKGDHIVMRPGQVSPGLCTEMTGKRKFKCGETYGLLKTMDPPVKPVARAPLPDLICIMEQTPYLDNLRTSLNKFCKRPATIYNQQRFLLVTKYIQQWGTVIAFIATLLSGTFHYTSFSTIGAHKISNKIEWTHLFIESTVSSVVPILPLIFPMMWIAINLWGIARLEALLHATETTMLHPHKSEQERSFHEDLDTPTCDYTTAPLSVQDVFTNWTGLWMGSSELLGRSANVVQVLGSITALCCIDKKGILSWPNPTAEKVFFLRDGTEKLASMSSQSSLESDASTQNLNATAAITGAIAEVLDLTHDQHSPFRMEFDDHEWKNFINSLKPMGLAILVNTCCPLTQAHYAQFCGHVTAVAMLDKDLVPVTNRYAIVESRLNSFMHGRCLCELAKQIGFTNKARDIFNLQGQIASYRHLQPDVVRRDIRFARQLQIASKVKVPFPHSLSVVMREAHSGSLQLLTQGTADIVLDCCDDYWDGKDLQPLGPSERKRAQDFYQRSALTAYCTAFAYRPLRHGIAGALGAGDADGDIAYLELPAESRSKMTVTNEPHREQPINHSISTDSLLFSSENKDDPIADVDGCFQMQCHQVFIGMVTMQYQAQTDIVQLVERLDRACIRFVHFSKENELRSRVFSEKMGLESGWNCHISLLSETQSEAPSPTSLKSGTPTKHPDAEETETDFNRLLPPSTLESSKTLSSSAPCAISDQSETCPMMTTTEEDADVEVHNNNKSPCSTPDQERRYRYRTRHSKDSAMDDENGRSLSGLTDSSEQSAPIHFDMSNRAKLPRGIENIRPHLENVDNVPLLVSLFTDCSAEATRQMLDIMQSYGEIVVCLGSSASNANAEIFLQADCSVAVEPLYPQVCQDIPPFTEANILNNRQNFMRHHKHEGTILGALLHPQHPRPRQNTISPIYLSRMLNSIPCSISVCRDDPLSIVGLIELSRRFSLGLWNCIQFWACCGCSLALLNTLASVLNLPPIITPLASIYIMCVAVPMLAVPLVRVEADSMIMNRATGKKQTKFDSKVLAFVIWCYGCKFLPSILVALFSYCALLSHPLKIFDDNEDASFDEVLSFSRQFVVFAVVVHFVIISLSFVHRDYSCWSKSPFSNRPWMICAIILALVHLVACLWPTLYFDTSHEILENAWPAVIVLFASTIVTFSTTELCKWQEIKVNLRYQRRARLDFGTKLGMNSPF